MPATSAGMTKGQRDSIRPKHALAEGTLDLTTSKNETAAVFDVTAYPLFTRALQLVPEAERRGPLVVDEDGPQSDADTTRISTAILPMPLVCRGQSGTCLHAMAV
jgi:hypothetical protein